MEITFKYEIGQFVKPNSPDIPLMRTGQIILVEPAPLIGKIAERIMQQCPGGIQLHYAVRWMYSVSRDGKQGSVGSGREQWLEQELAAYDPDAEKETYEFLRDAALSDEQERWEAKEKLHDELQARKKKAKEEGQEAKP